MHSSLSGIQQIGIGVTDAAHSLRYYRDLFGMNALVFDDTSHATLMTRYTGGSVYRRRAALTLNMQGGGGFEIWQFLDRTPAPPAKPPIYGAPGIFAARIKCASLDRATQRFQTLQSGGLSFRILSGSGSGQALWLRDAHGNAFQCVTGKDFFTGKGSATAGVVGAVIGVSDMERSLSFYQQVLGMSEVVYDRTDRHPYDADDVGNYRTVLLRSPAGKGAFVSLLGGVEIELVQVLHASFPHLYANRYWGDPGFIHLCFDVCDMDAFKRHASVHGCDFTVDSLNSFGMEDSAGRFCYLEDPDGTRIEGVETHRIPILKRFRWYLDLRKRGMHKPLPRWMLNTLAFNKVK